MVELLLSYSVYLKQIIRYHIIYVFDFTCIYLNTHEGMLTYSKRNQLFALYFASAITVNWCKGSTDVERIGYN